MTENIQGIEENRFNDLAFLATGYRPGGPVYRWLVKAGVKIFQVDPNKLELTIYESALKQHRKELLARSDILPEVKRYIEKYIQG